MKGYIYKLYAGADPGKGWIFNDPIFGSPPTLGACVPNLRRVVERGDWVFCISGRIEGYEPYLVGGLQVEEKIDALAAYERFPHYRLQHSESGQIVGNIIVDGLGQQHELDRHANFDRRLENYLVGGDFVHVNGDRAIAQARRDALPVLSKILDKPANRLSDVVPRWRKLNQDQVNAIRDWLQRLSGLE